MLASEEGANRPVLLDYFKAYYDTLWAKYEQGRLLKSPSDKGRFREIVVSEFFEKILPPRFRVECGGEIIDSYGSRSRQIDVLIVRDDAPRIPMSYGMVYLVEGVFATIEVKSVLDGESLNDALENMKSVSKLRSTPALIIGSGAMMGRPLRIVFAYESELSLEAIKERLMMKDTLGLVDILCVLNRGAIMKNANMFKPRDGGLIRMVIAPKTVIKPSKYEKAPSHKEPYALREDTLAKDPYIVAQKKLASIAFLYLYTTTYATSFLWRTYNLIKYLEPLDYWVNP